MKLTGTIDEWIKHNSKAFLVNKELFGDNVIFYNFKYHEEAIESTYPSYYPDGLPAIGNGCYMQKGHFHYSCGFSLIGCGGGFVLSNGQANDPNWEKEIS